jgi:hypothetical protein
MKRNFYILFVNMLFAALLFSLHHWVAIAKNHGDYTPFAVSRGVSPMTYDETYFYAPRAQRFMSLGQIPAEIDNYELRHSSAGIPLLPFAILGGMGRVLGSLEWAFIAAKAIFPALSLGLLYKASQGLIQSKNFRLLLAWGTILIPFAPRNFFWSGYAALITSPDFARIPEPGISFIFILLGILVSARALQPFTKRITVVAAGLIGALNVYSYYFYSIAWGMTLGILLILMMLWKNWMIAKRVVIMLSVMIGASLPNIIATARGKAEGGQTYLLERSALFTHNPRLVPLLCCSLGLFLVWKFGKRLFEGQEQQARIGMFILILLSGLAGLNFQILSGFDLMHDHFWNRLILPTAFFLCGYWIFSTVENLKRDRLRDFNRVALVALICIILNAGAREVYVGVQIAEQQRASRPEIELLMWARSNLPFGSVIGTVDPDLILMIPSTGPYFNYVPSAGRSFTSTSEIVDRYYELASLLGLSTSEVESIIKFNDVLDYSGTLQTFLEGYRRYRKEQSERLRKLDYVVVNSEIEIPVEIEKRFSHARILYINQKFKLIGL